MRCAGWASRADPTKTWPDCRIPFKEGTQVRLALWIQDKKVWALGKVVVSRPGSGIGIQFLEMKEEDRAELKRFVDSLPSMRR